MRGIEEIRERIETAISNCGLRLAHDRVDWYDEFVVVPDPAELGRFGAWIASSPDEAKKVLAEASGCWGKEEWLLSRVGVSLGIVTVDEARAIARSWAEDSVPDKFVLPGFLLAEED